MIWLKLNYPISNSKLIELAENYKNGQGHQASSMLLSPILQ